ncbi:LysM peptidoglycan-binding domain-containing protein [Aureimonas jatrophae]|nr:LysM peptidoglycan-binding domain-containing protein [Aureimonas jatrophae]MBB3949453.1 nucleoid-associated protein YgaU [Aureimonas jatrophae]
MRSRTALIALFVLLAAAAWGWRAGVVDTRGDRADGTSTPAVSALAPQASNQAPSVVSPAAVPAGQAAPAGTPADQKAAAEVAGQASPATPTFDVVRVEPDGSTVVAGRAKPGETVTLRNGGDALAETKATATGDFVLDLTLPAGEHRLRLSDAGNALSQDAAVVSVPAPGRPNDLLVMMDRPGQPTEILASPSRPQPDEVAPTAPVSKPDTQVASAVDKPVPTVATPQAGQEARPQSTLGVEAVEVENRRLSVAGAAPEGSRLNVYLDDKLVGQAGGTADERFIANAMADVSVGSHVVRIDEIGPDGSVVARAEVPFNRPDENSMAAIAPSAPIAEAQSPVADAPTVADASVASQRPSTDATGPTPADSRDEPSGVATAGPLTVVQPALQATQAKVIIRRGDTLWRISRRAYGQGVRYTVIYLANGDQIRNPNRIYPGQVFRMPDDGGRPPRT